MAQEVDSFVPVIPALSDICLHVHVGDLTVFIVKREATFWIPGKGQDAFAEELFIGGKVVDGDPDEVVGGIEHAMDLGDFVEFRHGVLEAGLAGLGIAALLPARIEGLEFALCALFTTLTLDAVKSRQQLPSLMLGAAAFIAAAAMVPHVALFAGLLTFVALLIGRYFLARRKGAHHA